jgi:hypothetical protein
MKSYCLRALVGTALVLTAVAGSPALADDVVHKGVDMWTTVQGFAQTSFAKDPLPAGFFCEGSAPFTGRVVMRGAPVATKPAIGQPVDTVVARLDDAAFDAKGVATTRIQLKALSLASVKPIETSCGRYDVTTHLAGEQPVTTMRILRTSAKGGTYQAPLALNVEMVFTPVGGDVRDVRSQRTVTRTIHLGPGSSSVWAFAEKPAYDGPIWIDGNGDGKPDTQVRGSNFIAGMAPGRGEVRLATWTTYDSVPTCPKGYCPKQSCHCNPDDSAWSPDMNRDGCADDHLHCVWVCVPATTTSTSASASGTADRSIAGTTDPGTSPSPGPTPEIDYACPAIADTIDF